jgi:phenylacetate-CoA ligase
LAYQEKCLGELLEFAVDQVPGYRHLRALVSRVSPFDALRAFPMLSKDELQQNMTRFLPRDFSRIPHYQITTGGTSGNQLRFYVDDHSHATETGFVHRYWKRMGYTPNCRKATFRGVPFGRLAPGIYWQENPIYRELQFSPFHMNESTLPSYVEKLIDYQAPYLHGYPSAIDILAEFILRHGIQDRIPEVRAIFLCSESCSSSQRQRIEESFRTRVFSWYGHSERLVFGGECEESSAYHQFPDYGILEIVDQNGLPVAEGDRGEIVGTGFLSRSLPLIRYRTGDSAIRLAPTCSCGRQWDRFCDVQGRWNQETVIGRNGTRISLAALNMHGTLFDTVRRYQYFQDTPGVCEVRLMIAPGFTPAAHEEIVRAYQAKVGSELDIVVRVVEDIPLTARGKLKLLVSTLTHDSGAVRVA